MAFGEPIPRDVLAQCVEHAGRADLVIVAGTSATVYPAAGFAIEVKRRGGVMIEANLYESELTPLADISLRGPTGKVMPRLIGAIADLRRAKLFVEASPRRITPPTVRPSADGSLTPSRLTVPAWSVRGN